MNRYKALTLLAECTGNEIWSGEHCRLRGIPEPWIEELLECYESGFQNDHQTIYYEAKLVNQFEGLRDVDIACKLGEYLGLDVKKILDTAWSPVTAVRAIREAAEEG